MSTAPTTPPDPTRVNKELEELWRSFTRTRCPRTRDRLILTYAPLVKYVAGRVGSTLPDHVERSDLISDGLVGLIEAVDRFRPSEGVKFESFALTRIRGAMLDRMRSLDWAPRSLRTSQRRIEQTLRKLEQRTGRSPSWDEVADELGVSREELDDALVEIGRSSLVALDRTLLGAGEADDGLDLYSRIADANADEPGSELELEEQRELLVKAIDALPERERLVLVLFYYEELPLRAISSMLGVTDSRVSQLQAQALVRLRARLRHLWPESQESEAGQAAVAAA